MVRGWLLVVFGVVMGVSVYGQSVRFSLFYDHPNHGAGLFEDVTLLSDSTILAVGPSLNFSNGYREAHHLVINESGGVVSEAAVASTLGQINTRAVLRSRFNNRRVFVSGYFCDYSTESQGPCDYFFSRVDAFTADTVFMKVYERPDTCDLLLGMVETRPNKILLLGYSCNDTVDGNRDVLLITVDTLGNEVNRVIYGGGGTDFISDGVVIDSTGDVLLAGYTKSFPSISNSIRTWILKTDSIGHVKWQKTYSGPVGPSSSAARISRSNNGNLLVAGGNENYGASAFGVDGSLMEIDTAGNLIWAKEYEVPGGQGLWGVVGLDDGTVVSCGVTDGASGSQAGWLIKTDENGDTLWTRTFDASNGTDYLRNMLVMPNGDIVMVGFGRGENSTTQDGWILRVDSMGCLQEGCFEVGMEELEHEEIPLSVYPNPCTNILNIRFQDSFPPQADGMTIEVTDMLGRSISSPPCKEGSGEVIQLDTSSWPSGIYLLHATNGQGTRSVVKVVKE